MIKNKRKIGAEKELLAVNYLKEQGYQIMEQNYFSRGGELDIVAREDNYLVFIEVKYRSNASMGMPAETVDFKKQKAIIRAARYYLYEKRYPQEQPCRFDVVCILGNGIDVIKNAFEAF